jgi:hypothetical protein
MAMPEARGQNNKLRYGGSTRVHAIQIPKAHTTGATTEVGPTAISQGEDSFKFVSIFFLKK